MGGEREHHHHWNDGEPFDTLEAENAKLRAQLMQAIAVLGELVSARDNAPAAVEERTVQSWRQARAFLANLFDAPKGEP